MCRSSSAKEWRSSMHGCEEWKSSVGDSPLLHLDGQESEKAFVIVQDSPAVKREI